MQGGNKINGFFIKLRGKVKEIVYVLTLTCIQ
jgi:hypothetical protein